MLEYSISIETHKYKIPFTIARGTKTEDSLVIFTVTEAGMTGRGEGVPVYYAGESVDTIAAQLESIVKKLRPGIHPRDMQAMLPRGGARNALDCALWDLESKRRGEPVWRLVGLEEFLPLPVTYTLGIQDPEAMAEAAREAGLPLYKVKLKGDGNDVERVAAIHEAAPDARLIIDANEGWTEAQVHDLVPRLQGYGVELIEQPMMAGYDHALADYDSPIPLCADESCSDAASIPALAGRYDFVNIKLDKSGGLTEALRIVEAAGEYGLRLMVGCMTGTSLSMAPGAIIGQSCEFVDLDGPLLYGNDRSPGAIYDNGTMSFPASGLWGEG